MWVYYKDAIPFIVRNIFSMTFYILNRLDLVLTVVLCCIIVALILFDKTFRKQNANSSRIPFPPGPQSRAIIGNLTDIPSAQPWITYTKWHEQYGDLIHFQVFRQHVVIVNSVKVANDLFEKRSSIYSDRPVVPMIKLSVASVLIYYLRSSGKPIII